MHIQSPIATFFPLYRNGALWCDGSSLRVGQDTGNRLNCSRLEPRCRRTYAQDHSGQLIKRHRTPCMAVATLVGVVLHAGGQMIFQHIPPQIPQFRGSLIESDFLQRPEQIELHGNRALSKFIRLIQCISKEALALMGRIDLVYRLPLCETTAANRAKIAETLRELGVLK